MMFVYVGIQISSSVILWMVEAAVASFLFFSRFSSFPVEDFGSLFEKRDFKDRQRTTGTKSTLSLRLEQCPQQLNNPFNEYSKFDGKVNILHSGRSVCPSVCALHLLPVSFSGSYWHDGHKKDRRLPLDADDSGEAASDDGGDHRQRSGPRPDRAHLLAVHK